MPAAQYARTLEGLTVNLLVRDITVALPFHRQVLGGEKWGQIYFPVPFAVANGTGK